jgi:hypothetical protein
MKNSTPPWLNVISTEFLLGDIYKKKKFSLSSFMMICLQSIAIYGNAYLIVMIGCN